MPDRLDREAGRRLTRLYAVALALVAVLTLSAQVVVQVALHGQTHDATVVNLAGRQRMLSQRLCKAALAQRHEELAQVLAMWQEGQERLARGDGDAHAGRQNSVVVADAFARLEPVFQGMVQAARSSDAARLMELEGAFLNGMEDIVGLYEREAAQRVEQLITIELGLCVLLLIVLGLEAWLVFRPAVRRLRQAIADRERLRERELANRELAVAAAVANDIGMDLHDGLGQSLTALSFQAQVLARRLPPGDATAAQALVAGIADAITQARALARRLSPVDVHAGGLESALRELCDATARSAGIDCRLDWQGDATASAGDDLYRIAQEAVVNALRHGRAKRIGIEVLPGRMTICDDGVGGMAGTEGVGLRSMRHRAARLGGSLEAGPQAACTQGQGWRVQVRFP